MKHTYFFAALITALIFLVTYPLEGQASGINVEKKPEISVRLFPNPSDGIFRLEMIMDTEARITARIYDMTGKMVKDISDQLERDGKQVTADIECTEASAGIHFLRVEAGQQRAIKKIIFR